mmetsp:Transcript_67361/g.135285  ORF Transcript_67361/g.135285 Transcript_67361/m.135285 type:complete len:348 (+) Transcript_67361:83-1126(+)
MHVQPSLCRRAFVSSVAAPVIGVSRYVRKHLSTTSRTIVSTGAQQLPDLIFSGDVHEIASQSQEGSLAKTCKRILAHRDVLAGFDSEWPPVLSQMSSHPRPSLLQLCLGAPGRSAAIVMLYRAPPEGSNFAKEYPLLYDTLMDAQIPKATQGAEREVMALTKHFGAVAQGFVCLPCVAAALQRGSRRQRLSLASLVSACLDHRLLKTDVRTSDWDTWPLSSVQRSYAATDAYASYCVFDALRKEHGADVIAWACSRMKPEPPLLALDVMNSATRETLIKIDGIGRDTADAILAGRPYTDMNHAHGWLSAWIETMFNLEVPGEERRLRYGRANIRRLTLQARVCSCRV